MNEETGKGENQETSKDDTDLGLPSFSNTIRVGYLDLSLVTLLVFALLYYGSRNLHKMLPIKRLRTRSKIKLLWNWSNNFKKRMKN